MMNIKECYVNFGPLLLIVGSLIIGISLILAYVYAALTNATELNSENPFGIIYLFGMLLTCIGGFSFVFDNKVI